MSAVNSGDKNCKDDDLVDVDVMLEHAGGFGKYQYILMGLFGFINVISGFHYFGQSFIFTIPSYHCVETNPQNGEEELEVFSCSTRVDNTSGVFEKPCTKWAFNGSYGYISLTEELELICENSWKPALGQSVFFIGSVFGSLAFGALADHIGRLHVLVASNMFAFLGNLTTLLSSNLILLCLSRFLAGLATDANFVMMYIIVMEYMKPSMRTIGLNLCIGVFYCLSCVMVPWVAVWSGNWRIFLIAVAVPHILVLLFYFLVPESAQWLLSVKKTDEAVECFRRVAKINKKQLDEKIVEGFKNYAKENVNSTCNENLFVLFKTPKLRKKTLILIFKSMVVCLCYDAISRDVNGFGYSSFLIFSLTSITILPGCLFILLVQDRVGRKALSSTSLLISGIFCLIIAIFQVNSISTITLSIFMIISRFAIIVAYNSSTQYAVELIPTVVRGQGVSAIHVSGYMVTFFSPQILYLANYWKPLPELVLGCLLMMGSVACLFLPETLYRTLPVTLEDGENFGEDEKLFEFAWARKNLSESTYILTTITTTPNKY
ncbi:organic cation transporter protein [Agrilus planipennis]|uniref:Organic cation transporter protein n=1 Tax=Agrilus planipennis TaxID=224129 RepID=A0A1W4WCG4_AGRPL|nr:organic cation transporter protein [Agrilus planipennis]XP_018321666.1 organic cation transporter protein [Agrilus planipennis]XP_018321667.1 organic cation transporter protein [Agrilus planipennis]